MDALGYATGFGIIALGLVLSLMKIPLGRGIFAYVVFALLGSMSRAALAAIQELFGIHYTVTYGRVTIYLEDAVYYAVLFAGLFGLIVGYHGRSRDAVQALAGFAMGLAIDAASLYVFMYRFSNVIRFVTMFDIINQLVAMAAQSVMQYVTYVTAASALSMVLGALPFFGFKAGVALAFAIIGAAVGFIRWIAELYNAYAAKLVQGVASTMGAAFEDGLWLVFITMILSFTFGQTVVMVYCITIGTTIALYGVALVMYMILQAVVGVITAIGIAATVAAAISPSASLVGAAAGDVIGSLGGGRFLYGLTHIGGREAKEIMATIYAAAVTIVVYLIGFTSFYPLVLAVVILFILANVYTAARLVVGVPRRFLSRYISAVYTLTLFLVAMKTVSGFVGVVALALADQITSIVENIVEAVTYLVLPAAVWDQIINWFNSMFGWNLPTIKDYLIQFILTQSPIAQLINGLTATGQRLIMIAQDP